MSNANSHLHTKFPVAIGMGLVGSFIVAIVLLAFVWPTKTMEVHNVPLTVAGPSAAVTAIEKSLDDKAPGTFEYITATDKADAIHQIETRQSLGAIVTTSSTAVPEVLTAPAANAAVAQTLTGMAAQLQIQIAAQVQAVGGNASAVKVNVTPVVSLNSNDPTGAGLTAAAFPLMMGGMLAGILVTFLVVGIIRRIVAVFAFAAFSGLILTLIMQPWFGFLQGEFWLNVLAVGMSVLATGMFIVGCTSLIGRPGIAVGAVVTLFVANPISAAATPWQFIASPWGAIGQNMVPGASNWLIRSISYFPSANNSQQWIVLSAWAGVGLILALIGHFRSQETVQLPESTLAEG